MFAKLLFSTLVDIFVHVSMSMKTNRSVQESCLVLSGLKPFNFPVKTRGVTVNNLQAFAARCQNLFAYLNDRLYSITFQ